MTPAANLVLAVAAVIGTLILLHPRRGMLWKWWQGRKVAERIRVEDALKHFHDCEYAQLPATMSSLAGALEIGRDEAARLSALLESMGLVVSDSHERRLTPDGRSYALRVIRIHRLWERHLADRTGVAEQEWHHQADEIEHTMSAEQAEALSAQLGNPTFDPHGAPIPTADGDMPKRRGIPLPALEPGARGTIVHVEDEPDTVYAQLVAARLYPGVVVRVLESTAKRMRIEAELQEHVLAPRSSAAIRPSQNQIGTENSTDCLPAAGPAFRSWSPCWPWFFGLPSRVPMYLRRSCSGC